MTPNDNLLLETRNQPRLSEDVPLKRYGIRVYCLPEVGLEVWLGDRLVTVELRKHEAEELARRILLAVDHDPKMPALH
jgi:hypothetical protein